MRKFHLLLVATLFFVSASQAQTCEEKKLTLQESVGYFSGAYMYNTYLAIGSVADGYHHKAYDSTNARALAEEQISMLESSIKQMEALLKKKSVEGDDVDFVNQCIAIFKGLKEQGKHLKDFIAGITSAGEKFQTQRKKNWADMADLLGFDN